MSRAQERIGAWIGWAFFADLDPEHEDALADILAVVHESLLREGTLPRPDLT